VCVWGGVCVWGMELFLTMVCMCAFCRILVDGLF